MAPEKKNIAEIKILLDFYMQDGYNTHCDSGRFLGVEEVVGSNPAAPTISDRQPLRVTPVKAYFFVCG